jgi:hypothetical protein
MPSHGAPVTASRAHPLACCRLLAGVKSRSAGRHAPRALRGLRLCCCHRASAAARAHAGHAPRHTAHGHVYDQVAADRLHRCHCHDHAARRRALACPVCPASHSSVTAACPRRAHLAWPSFWRALLQPPLHRFRARVTQAAAACCSKNAVDCCRYRVGRPAVLQACRAALQSSATACGVRLVRARRWELHRGRRLARRWEWRRGRRHAQFWEYQQGWPRAQL